MNKAEMIDMMAKEAGITKAQAAKALDAFTGGVKGTLSNGDKVLIAGFGTFQVTEKAARVGRNPQTGEEIQIAAKKAPKFTPGKEFKEAVAK